MMKLGELNLIKQSRAREIVQRALRHGRTAHAYLLHGPEGGGKEALALALAQSFLCEHRRVHAAAGGLEANATAPDWACGDCSSCRRVVELTHPDVHVVMPRPAGATEQERTDVLRSLAANPFHRERPWENPYILIDDIRALKRSFAVSSYEGGGAVALLLEADRLKAESANALLKILEEPPPDNYFVLTAASLESLLPTIVSRCQSVAVPPMPRQMIAAFLQEQHGVEAARAEFLAMLANGSVRQALALLEDDLDAKRKLAVEYLRMAFKFHKPVEQVDFLNQLAGDHDRRELQQVLQLCLVWIRDAYLLKIAGTEAGTAPSIVNADFRGALEELIRNLPEFDFAGVLEEIEYAIASLERYVQPWLVLMVLLQRIRQLARPGR